MLRVNVDGTRHLLSAAFYAKVPRIVYTSSVATIKTFADGTLSNEETPTDIADMIGVYKQSKFEAEQAVRKMIAHHLLPCVIVNPSTPIGPGDIKPTPTGRLIVEAALGRMPAFVDTGLNVVHVDDVAMGHWLAYERGVPGERYILGGENLAFSEILRMVAHEMNLKPPKIKLPIAPLFPLAYLTQFFAHVTGREPLLTVDGLKMARKKMYFANDKAKADLGYAPRPAAEAVHDSVAWFRINGYC
jgi:dihydroflavonol-4-reductase